MTKMDGVTIRIQIGIRPQLVKPVKVQLSHETLELGMLKVQRQYLLVVAVVVVVVVVDVQENQQNKTTRE